MNESVANKLHSQTKNKEQSVRVPKFDKWFSNFRCKNWALTLLCLSFFLGNNFADSPWPSVIFSSLREGLFVFASFSFPLFGFWPVSLLTSLFLSRFLLLIFTCRQRLFSSVCSIHHYHHQFHHHQKQKLSALSLSLRYNWTQVSTCSLQLAPVASLRVNLVLLSYTVSLTVTSRKLTLMSTSIWYPTQKNRS